MPRSDPCNLFGWLWNLCEPIWAKVSRFCGHFCGVLASSGSHNPFFTFSTRFSEVYQMFGYGSMYLFSSIAGWVIDDNWPSQWSTNTQNIIRNISLNFLSVIFGSILVLWDMPFQGVTREHSLPWYGSQDGPVTGWSLAQISIPPLPGQNIL